MFFSHVTYRLLIFIFTLWVASVVIFVALTFLPGDAASVLLGVQADVQSLERLRSDLGLDRPIFLRYVDWVSHFVRGDWGKSLIYGRPVWDMIKERALVSFTLALFAMTLVLIIAFLPGVFAAIHHHRRFDYMVMFFSQIMMAIPGFWLGIMLMILFAVSLDWFPAGGFQGWDQGFFEALKSLFLPALALALPQASILLRMVRFSMLEIIFKPFLLLAKAKGLGHIRAVFTHGLRNGLAPILVLCAIQLSFLLVGAIVIETVFSLPGLGRLVFLAVMQRDWVVLQTLIVLFVVVVLVIHLLADLIQLKIDPRLQGRQE